MTRARLTLAAVSFAAALLAGLVVPACSSASTGSTTATSDASTDQGKADAGHLAAPLHPDGSCPITIDTPELLMGTHVPEGTPITWSSNPPSSGPHFSQWANYQEFSQPVNRGYLVHSLEHGGVVLFYKCEGATCDNVLAELRKVRDAVPTDSRCDPSIRARVVIVPDPLLDVPIAAATWGWTYKADCVDLPTLEDFARSHYGQGTEDICAPGKTKF
jgi:hypothetical protein